MYMFKLWNVMTGMCVRIMLHGVQMLDISCLRRRNIRNIISSTLNVDHHNNTNVVRSAFLSILMLNLVRCKYSTVLRMFLSVHIEGRPTIASYSAGKIKISREILILWLVQLFSPIGNACAVKVIHSVIKWRKQCGLPPWHCAPQHPPPWYILN